MSKCTTFPLALAGVLLVGAFGVMRLEAQREEAEAATEVAEETKYAGLSQKERRELRRRIENTVRERGTVQSASKSIVTSRVPGTATILSLKAEGARVKKGEVVGELDGTAIQDKLRVQDILVAKAEAELKQATIGLATQRRQSEVAAAAVKKAVDVAKLANTKWKHEYEVQLAAVAGEISVAEARLKAARTRLSAGGNGAVEARVSIAEAESALRIAAAKRKLLTGAEKDFQVAARELEVLKREAELLKVTQLSQIGISTATSEKRLTETTLQAAKQQRDRLARQLESCKLRAPRDGNVVYAGMSSRRSEPVVIEEGASIRERQPILNVVDFRRLQFRVRVHESRINRVKIGQPVALRFDAIPQRAFTGTVRSVAGTPERGEWPNTDVKIFYVMVSIDRPTDALKPGMSGEAEIDVSKSE